MGSAPHRDRRASVSENPPYPPRSEGPDEAGITPEPLGATPDPLITGGIPALPLSVPPTPAPRRARGPRWVVGILASFLVLVAMIAGVIAMDNGAFNLSAPASTSGSSGERPRPEVVPGPVPVTVPTPSASPSATETPVAEGLPANCDALYSDAFKTALAADGDPNTAAGLAYQPTTDTLLAPLLATPGSLRCSWGDPTARGLLTTVASIGKTQAANVVTRLESLGAKCYAEFSGTRCVRSMTGSGGGPRGESHLLRNGIWISTYWTAFSPDGYTAELAKHVFPAAR